MLHVVRPYEYLIIQKIVEGAGKATLRDIRCFTENNICEADYIVTNYNELSDKIDSRLNLFYTNKKMHNLRKYYI